jgi:rhamnogalacturonyl hydrolase YesR
MSKIITDSFYKLLSYCEKEEFKGYDPYDGLNSRFFRSLPYIRNNRLARLAWIQAFKRSPVNLRSFVGIKKDYNPKAVGLFLAGYCNLYHLSPSQEYKEKIYFFASLLEKFTTKGYSGACWGYNFDWQARAFFQPKHTPTVVATTFIANALLDAFEITKEKKFLDITGSSCRFILKDLNRTYDDTGNFSFSYSPLDKSVVFNASLLGSRLLARVYSFTGEKELIDEAQKSVAFCCNYQKENGSWSYGTLPFHKWIDNFHTGYNLECIYDYMKYSGDNSYQQQLDKGFEFYVNNFFTEEGISKYYNTSKFPIDIHAPAQLVITISKLGKFEEYEALVEKVLIWTIKNMQSDKGYFYYQINKYFSSKIPYMRWAQAWMFFSLSTYIRFKKLNLKTNSTI